MNKKWKYPGCHTKYSGLYKSWSNMLRRASNKDGKNPSYTDVTVCDRWLSYDNFFEDMADTWFKGATIDKDSIKPGNRVYCKEYCCWMTRSDNDKERWNRLGNPLDGPGAMEKFLKTIQPRIDNMRGNKVWSKKVRCIETGEIFESTIDAERKYNLKRFSVSRSANPKELQKTAGGYHWEYIE